MEGEQDQSEYEKSFLEVPAILDKTKAAADVCNGKKFKTTIKLEHNIIIQIVIICFPKHIHEAHIFCQSYI